MSSHALPGLPRRTIGPETTGGAAPPPAAGPAGLARLARQVFRITHVDIRQYRAPLLAEVIAEAQAGAPAGWQVAMGADAEDAGPTPEQAWALTSRLESAAWQQALPRLPVLSPPRVPDGASAQGAPPPQPTRHAAAGALVWVPACPDDGLALRLRAALQSVWPASTWLVTRTGAWPAASGPADGLLRRSHNALHDPPPAGCRVVIGHGLLEGVADHVRRRLLLQLATTMDPSGLLWLPDAAAAVARTMGWRPARPLVPDQAWLHPPSAESPGEARPSAPPPAAQPANAPPDLLRALHRRELLLHYQPQFELATGRLCGMEALLRWQHPVRGLVGPQPLVRHAEAHGGIHALGRWVLAEACRQLARWQADGHAVGRIAVNVSSLQWLRPRFVDEVLTAVGEAGLRPAQLVLELTESCPWPSTPGPAQALVRCRAAGIGLSLDDFGTGHAGLHALQHLPLSQLKVDAGLVARLPGDARGHRLIDIALDLARQRGLELVVEGVQRLDQLAPLRRLGAHAYQGHLGAAAQDPQQVTALLHRPAPHSGSPVAPA